MNIKKISYRSRPVEKHESTKNMPAVSIGDDNTSENAGRYGYIMPGDLYPVSSGNPPEYEKKIDKNKLKKNLLYLKTKKLDKQSFDFVNFIFRKIAESENISYEKLFMKDMFDISISTETRAMEIINDLCVYFSSKIKEIIESGVEKEEAKKQAYAYVKQKYPIKKNAQVNERDPKFVAKYIAGIILIMISKFSMKSRLNARSNIRRRVSLMNIQEMSNKKTPAGASIGTSIALVKNILNGKDPYFIKTVIDEIQKNI